MIDATDCSKEIGVRKVLGASVQGIPEVQASRNGWPNP